MKKILLVSITIFLFNNSFGQLEAVPSSLVDDLPQPSTSLVGLKMKSAANPKTCSEDTLEYARYKASGFQAIAISDGFALGQYYDAPDSILVSGITFYGWTISTANDSVDVTISLYEAGTDTLPAGAAIRSTTVRLDTTFNGGSLATLRKSIAFNSPYKTGKPYIITISSTDSVRVGVVCNSYNNADGLEENIACGTVSNIWYRCMNLNIGGTTLDCDVLLEPHATYDTYAEFTLADCYNWQDSLSPNNQSSPILKHRMYNRYISYNLGQYSYYWYGGPGTSTVYGDSPKLKFPNPANRTVRLVTTMYGYRNGIGCRDTAYQSISYQPDVVSLFADTPVCSGNTAIISGISNANVYWYSSPNESSLLDSGTTYITPILTEDKTYYTKAVNNGCSTSLKSAYISVAQQPSPPIVQNDSICLNAKANLTATTDYGNVIWWTDSIAGKPLDTGFVFTSDALATSTSFYAQADNRGCISTSRTEAVANVNSSNAPTEPITALDSLVCLHDGSITLKATSASGDSVRWFDVPSFGNPIGTGNTFSYNPNSVGAQYLYVDAFDGQCASSRIEKRLQVWNFPTIAIKDKDTICFGDTLTVDYSAYNGSIRWYDSAVLGNQIFDSTVVKLHNFSGDVTYYLEPYSQMCKDTLRHSLTVSGLDAGKVYDVIGDEVCETKQADLSAKTSAGQVVWSLNSSFSELLGIGNSYKTDPLSVSTTFYVASKNLQCLSEFTTASVKVNDAPSANYNYQVNDIADFTFTALEAGKNYSWNLGDGTVKTGRTVNHKYSKNGQFIVELTVADSKSCNTKMSREIKVAGLITGIDDKEQDIFHLYPNPAANELTIVSSLGNSNITIINKLGKTVHSLQSSNSVNRLNIADLPSGMYVIIIQSDKKVYTKKVLIQK